MYTRRKFLKNFTAASGSALLLLKSNGLKAATELARNLPADKRLKEIASDESFWQGIQNAFDIDRTVINLNNGGLSPQPRVVIDSFKKQVDFANKLPAYNLWEELEPKVERVREKLADAFGCDKEEIAITRNTSESLEIIQQGMNLKTGDEVLTTYLDYPRMITTFEQMNRRYGINIVKIDYPTPLLNREDYINAIADGITNKTKVILISHVCNVTGQILPVKEISQMAHEKQIQVICDGAHSFNHIPFKLSDIECDYFGTSFHKWTYAPVGTGMLYMKKELIKNIWPLMPAPKEMDNDIRKFEEIGTHPAANHNAVLEALEFNNMIGIERKAERLRYLNKIWINKLREFPNVKFNINIDDETNWAGIINFYIEGVNTSKLEGYLWNKHNILTVAVRRDGFEGIRVTPNVYTTAAEIERFAEVIKPIVKGEVREVLN